MSLSELEKQIGTLLFDRINNRLVLNHEGKMLLPLVDELLSRAQDIETLFHNHEPLPYTLRVGASETIGNQVAPYLLGSLTSTSPEKLHKLFISNSALICEKLMDYELDIGLIEGSASYPDLSSYPFSEDKMCIISAPSDSLVTLDNIQFDQLNNRSWILREPGSGTREFFIHTVVPHLKIWHETIELNTTESIINSVSAGLGLACLSELAVGSAITDGRVKRLDTNTEMKREFCLMIHKEKYRSPLIKRFIKHCLESNLS